jgi:hypothetical protein
MQTLDVMSYASVGGAAPANAELRELITWPRDSARLGVQSVVDQFVSIVDGPAPTGRAAQDLGSPRTNL